MSAESGRERTSAQFRPLSASTLPLSRHQLDRDYLGRSATDLFASLRLDPRMRQLVLWNGLALLDQSGALNLLPSHTELDSKLTLYLGRSADPLVPKIGAMLAGQSAPADQIDPVFPVGPAAPTLPVVAVIVTDEVAQTLAPLESSAANHGTGSFWGDLRTLGKTFSDRDAGLFTAALALANWHDSHRFSPRTGMATVAAQGGWVRTDVETGGEVFPRTDSAVIVAVVDADDRLLLGHNAMWPSNRYSLLAGFVEPGESLENAAVREVFEESGIRIIDPVYVGSQPWPFPASLMVGFMARVNPQLESILTPDGKEILDLRWFSRDELFGSLEQISLPGHTSIARAMIENWYGSPISDRRQW